MEYEGPMKLGTSLRFLFPTSPATHAGLDVAFADQSTGDIGKDSSLDLKALDLEIGMAENVVCCLAHDLSLSGTRFVDFFQINCGPRALNFWRHLPV